MERVSEQHLAPCLHSCEALAFDRNQRNRRPVFALTHRLQRLADGRWHARRDWRGCGTEVIASEDLHWLAGLQDSRGEMPSIGEVTDASCSAGGCESTLRSHKTGHVSRERTLVLPHEPVTLGSLPLLAARHWTPLMRGERRLASYLVLKVQRAATVRLERLHAGKHGGTNEATIAVTPTNPVLRWLFGSTQCVFDADAPRLRRIEGLLDPRDLKANGRWREYLGTIEFQTPLDLSGLAEGTAR